MENQEFKAKLTENGHVDTNYYLSKARLLRGQALIDVLNWTRIKFIRLFRASAD